MKKGSETLIIVAAIAAAGYLLLKNSNQISSALEGLSQGVQGIGQGTGTAVQGLGEGISTAGQGLGYGLGTAGVGLGEGIYYAGEGLGQGLGIAGLGLGSGIGEAGLGLGSGIGEAGYSVLKQVPTATEKVFNILDIFKPISAFGLAEADRIKTSSDLSIKQGVEFSSALFSKGMNFLGLTGASVANVSAPSSLGKTNIQTSVRRTRSRGSSSKFMSINPLRQSSTTLGFHTIPKTYIRGLGYI